MKTLLLILLLVPVLAFGQTKDLPPEYATLNPSNNKAIFGRDSSNIAKWQFTLRNDTATKTDSLKFYEIVNGDSIILRFENGQTGAQDTMVTKTGKPQDYILTKAIVGRVCVKLLSPTSIDIWLRKRRTF